MKFQVQSLLFIFIMLLGSCSKDDTTVEIKYNLETSALTGDHFYVSYVNASKDTITEHVHPGWVNSFKVAKPFNAYIKAEVIPIDTYNFTINIIRNGEAIKTGSASTASGAKTTIVLNHSEQ